MEETIKIVNKLQSVISQARIPNQIQLPQIVVVGSQSAGKSSVLESIVGKDFLPRGSDICTRRPLIIQLNHADIDAPYGQFQHKPLINYSDFSQIRDEIVAETDREVNSSKNVSKKPIILSIYSRDVLTITLVDLPGIIKVVKENQDPSIIPAIDEMAMEYISNEKAIILAISSGHDDLGISLGLEYAQRVDPNRQRTLGVLTKLDLSDASSLKLKEIRGEDTVVLRYGFIGVVCRSQQDILNNKPISDHLI